MGRTLMLVLDCGWLRLLNLHGSDGVSTGSRWNSEVTPSGPGSWKTMEMGRSFLQTKGNGRLELNTLHSVTSSDQDPSL